MLNMAINKRLLSSLSALMMAVALFADNGVNSPYSRFGLGTLSDQNLAINRQMGGLGYALRESKYINLLNPASLAQADTLTMLFEAGFSLQNVNFKGIEVGNRGVGLFAGEAVQVSVAYHAVTVEVLIHGRYVLEHIVNGPAAFVHSGIGVFHAVVDDQILVEVVAVGVGGQGQADIGAG